MTNQEAIKALEEMRQELICISQTPAYFNEEERQHIICLQIEVYKKAIDALKQPKRMKGKWVRITRGATPEQYICPFCFRKVETYGVEEFLKIQYPYCHCGADMRGEEDD